MKSLRQHESIFDRTRPSFSLLSIFQPKVCGDIEDYTVEMGIVWEHRDKSLIYKVKLKNPIKLPLFFWDKFLLSSFSEDGIPSDIKECGSLEIQKRQWLVRYAYYGETLREVSKYLEKTNTESIRAAFCQLVALAKKIDRGEISLDSKIEKQKRSFYKDSFIVIIIIIIMIPLIYWWLYH